jgi:WD40 repeat protein
VREPRALPDEPQQRRLLIATGVTTGLEQSANRLVESVGRMVGLFESELGYRRVTSLNLNPSADEMRNSLRAFAKACSPTDIVAVYHTGHGDVGARGHRLWMGDTKDPVDALVTAELAEKLLDDTPVSNLLIILDTCSAGQGGTEALVTGLRAAGDFPGKTVGAITAAHPKEQVRAGDFVGLFERAVSHAATGGHEPRYLQPLTIVEHIDSDPQRRKWQTVSYSTLLGSRQTAFLCNPRYDESLHGLDVSTQLQIKEAKKRREDLSGFFAAARENFIGRDVALRKLNSWLVDKANFHAIVVTGGPGSGKSAVIGQLVTLSDRQRRRTVPRQGLQADTIPTPDSIDVAIHARNRGSKEILQALCAAAQVTAATPGDFLQATSGKQMVAAIDAIDEAIDANGLVQSLLDPLIKNGPEAGFRMLLGTRTHLLAQFSTSNYETLNLDDPTYADPQSLRTYAQRRLRSFDGSPYREADPSKVATVAAAVADAAGKSFLVAHMASRSLAQRPEVADPEDAAWRNSLPSTAAEAMQKDLEARLGPDEARARDLLLPLAYANGKGLPWENIWAPLASLLAGKKYDNEDLIWLDENAGSYFVEGIEAGRSVYSLYHAALADYLRQGQSDRDVHAKFVSFLLDCVPRDSPGRRSWSDAHPYITLHLATHAADAGELEKVAVDPVYLACADPIGLFTAFAVTREQDVQAISRAYERAMHRLRSSDLADKLSYLELSARRTGATALAESISASPVRRRWSVRWTQWPPEHPHRVLAGHRGAVREVVGVSARERAARAASVGDDGTLRLWDLAVAEPLALHEVSRSGLAAVDVVELPGPEYVAVVLSTAGFLTAHELPSLSQVLAIRASSAWQGMWQPLRLSPTELRCLTLPDGRSVAITAGHGMMTSIWDIQAGTALAKLPAGLRPARVLFRTVASGDPVVVSADARLGAEHVFDLATGRRIPDIRSVFRRAEVAYYCRDDGMPVVSLLARYGVAQQLQLLGREILRGPSHPAESKPGSAGHRDRVTLFDLTGPTGMSRTVPKLQEGNELQLLDGSRIRIVYDRQQHRLRPSAEFWGGDRFVRLSETIRHQERHDLSTAGSAKHAGPSASFPFMVTLDGRVIVLAPVGHGALKDEPIVLTGHGAQVTDVATVPTLSGQTLLISSSVDGTVRIWDVDASVERIYGLADDSSPIILSALARQGRTLGVTLDPADYADAAVVDLGTGELVARLEGSGGWMTTAACGRMPDAGDVVVGFGSGRAQIWRLPDGKAAAFFATDLPDYPALTGRLFVPTAYVELPGRPLAITCGHGNKAVIWDLVGRRIHNVLPKHSGWTSAVACTTTPNGSVLVATGGDDNRVNIWNIVRGRRAGAIRIIPRMSYLLHRDAGLPTEISFVMTKTLGLIVLVLSEDGRMTAYSRRKWRRGFRRIVIDVNGATSMVAMQLTSGQTFVVTGDNSGRISAWDLEALSTVSPDASGARPLIEIETELPITSLAAGGDDTLVTSGPNGLAAFRLDGMLIPGGFNRELLAVSAVGSGRSVDRSGVGQAV